MSEDRTLLTRNIHVPSECENCGKGKPEYKGVGEYKCSECGHIMYDDYGIVRNYLEAHRGATQSEVSRATGVAMETIRAFLKDDRIEIIEGSGVFMACEICRAPIRSGRYCENCARKVRAKEELEKSASHKSGMQGYGQVNKGASGAKRFTR